MAELAAGTGLLWDSSRMAEAVRAREDLHPTALDNGVALLHPRRPVPEILGDNLLALGVTGQGIGFGGSRGVLTDIFFLIGAIDDRSHLRILARLSRLVSQTEVLDRLRGARDAAEAIAVIEEAEQGLPG
jgi:PTS system nitrogen regulatory IIA component